MFKSLRRLFSRGSGTTERDLRACLCAEGHFRVVKEAWTEKRGGLVKNWKRRYLVLVHPGVLIYFNTQEAAQRVLSTVRLSKEAVAAGPAATATREVDEAVQMAISWGVRGTVPLDARSHVTRVSDDDMDLAGHAHVFCVQAAPPSERLFYFGVGADAEIDEWSDLIESLFDRSPEAHEEGQQQRQHEGADEEGVVDASAEHAAPAAAAAADPADPAAPATTTTTTTATTTAADDDEDDDRAGQNNYCILEQPSDPEDLSSDEDLEEADLLSATYKPYAEYQIISEPLDSAPGHGEPKKEIPGSRRRSSVSAPPGNVVREHPDLPAPLNEETFGEYMRGAMEAGKYDWIQRWNLNFTKAGLVRHVEAREVATEAAEQLRQLQDDFELEVRRTARIIVRERYLPDEERSIRAADMGGIAGGVKFVHNNIMYKFALDNEGLYGGDEYAMKAASMEFIGSSCLVNANVMHSPRIGVPMTAMVDYLGFRLTATCLLPLGKHTLAFGSDDACNTMHYDDEIAKAMARAAQVLNLRGHYVNGMLIHGPGDIEVHVGTDGMRYVIDTARVMPPEPPVPKVKGAFLYRLLRPECVKKNPVPLSSDAFSFFGRHNMRQLNQDVRDCYERLVKEIIPQTAATLDARDEEMSRFEHGSAISDEQMATRGMFQSNQGLAKQASIVEMSASMDARALDEGTGKRDVCEDLHDAGINLRHLGRVRTHAKRPVVRRRLLEEMVVRTLKTEFRKAMRTVPSLAAEQSTPEAAANMHKTVVTRLFNLWFLDDKQNELTTEFWTHRVKFMMLRKFPHALTEEEQAREFDIRSALRMSPVFQATVQACQLEVDEDLLDADLPLREPVTEEQIEDVNVRVRVLGLVPRLEAEAMTEAIGTCAPEELDDLVRATHNKWREALRANPHSEPANNNYGSFLLRRMHRARDALACYERALELNPMSAGAAGNIAFVYWSFLGEIDKAIEAFERAVAIDPRHASNVCLFMCCLVSNGRRDHPIFAQHTPESLLELNWPDPKSIGNYAMVLHLVYEHFDEADRYYQVACQRNPDDAQMLSNYGAFLADARRDYERAEEVYQKALQRSPNDVPSLVFYSALLLNYLKRDYDKAREMLERALNLQPDNKIGLITFARLMAEHAPDEAQNAEQVLRRVLLLDPDNCESLTSLASILLVKGNHEEAQECIDKIKARGDAQAMRNLSVIAKVYEHKLHDVKKTTELVRWILDHNRDGPRVADVAYDCANVWIRFGRQADALALYNHAIFIDPAHVLALNTKWKILFNLGQIQEAMSVMARLLEVDPGHVEALRNLGVIYCQMGQLHLAEQLYQTAVEKTKGEVWGPLYAYGRHLFAVHQDAAAAFPYLKQAVALHQDNAELLGDFGGVCLVLATATTDDPARRQELFDLGETMLKQALARKPVPDMDLYNLACVYAITDRLDECREALLQAKAVGPSALPSLEHLQQDPDMANARAQPWWPEIIA